MEWQKNGLNQNANDGMMQVNVMTDEQIETLRKQIAVYTVISQQLIETHKTLSSQQDLTLTGGSTRLSMYCDPLINKVSSRQRWIPTPVQLQTLERIFEAETGTPSKEKVKEITADLTKHGPISETSVYNWFQNRRARSKRKEQNNVNDVPEVETEVNSEDKKTEQDDIVTSQPSENLCRQSAHVFSDLADLNPESGDNLRPFKNFDQVPAFDAILSNSRSSDYLIGKVEAPEN